MSISKIEKKRVKTGGRKPGSPNRKTAELQKAVAASGVTPLDFMLKLMRKPYPRGATGLQKLAHDNARFEAAKAAAPYVHAKLANVELNAKVTTRTLAEELAELNAKSDPAGH